MDEPTFKIQRDLWLTDLIFNTREMSAEEAVEMAREMGTREQRFWASANDPENVEAWLDVRKAVALGELRHMYEGVVTFREEQARK